MRVDYTLPSLQPWTPSDTAEIPQEGQPSFREMVRGEPLALPSTIEQQLRLDLRPFTGTYIGPPPRPKTLDVHDAETQRMRWHAMISKHAMSPGTGMGAASDSERSVANMVEMLLEMQHLEDSIVSQSVSLTRG
jgi:hypothetical protein